MTTDVFDGFAKSFGQTLGSKPDHHLGMSHRHLHVIRDCLVREVAFGGGGDADKDMFGELEKERTRFLAGQSHEKGDALATMDFGG